MFDDWHTPRSLAVVANHHSILSKMFLLLSITIHFFWSIARQLSKHVMILTHSHRSLLESPKLIWLEFYHTCGNVVWPEALAKLLPRDLSNIVGMSILVRLPLVLLCALELAGCKNTFSWSSHWAMSNCRSTALRQSSASSGSLVWENVGGCPFINSPLLLIGDAWCGLFNTLWAIIYNNWVCVIKACSIDGGFDGGGLELAGFLLSES